MDFTASDRTRRPATGTDSSSARGRHNRCSSANARCSGNAESSEHRTSSSRHHHPQHRYQRHQQPDDREFSESSLASSSLKERRGSQAQEPQHHSLDDTSARRLSSSQSSRLPPRRHERLSLAEGSGERQGSFAATPLSSTASEMMRSNSELARPNGVAAVLAKDSTPINSRNVAGFSAMAATAPAPSSSPSSFRQSPPSSNFSAEPPAVESGNAVYGLASPSQSSAHQPASSQLEAVIVLSSPTATSLVSLEAATAQPDWSVRSWQQSIRLRAENRPPSLTSVGRSDHSTARSGPPPPPAPRLTSSHRLHADIANLALSSSSASVRTHASEVTSQTSSKQKRASEAPSVCGAGKACNETTEGAANGGISPALHPSAAASSAGVSVVADAAVTTRQPPSVRSRTSSTVVGVERRSGPSVCPEGGEASSTARSAASSVHQQLLPKGDSHQESQSRPRHGSGARLPSPASASLTPASSVAVASPLKASGQQASQRSFRAVASLSSSPVADAPAPNRARGSITPRPLNDSRRSASPLQRRSYQLSVTSHATTAVEPFRLSTECRSTIRRTASPCCASRNPLAEVPAQELQRVINLPRQVHTVPGISRLDITFEEDAKELYRQTHLVDPLLLRRPGRRQFYIPEQADLFGMYPEPSMTMDEDGNEVIKHLAPIPIQGQRCVQPKRRSSAVSPKNSADHDTSDKSASPPPMAPAPSVQRGKATGADALEGRNGEGAVVRPGRSLSSFVAGYGEEAAAKGSGGLTPPRRRVISEITASYRRNMAANTGLTGHSRRESLMPNCLPLPGGPETTSPASVRLLSPDVRMAVVVSQTPSPFAPMQPTPSSDASNVMQTSNSDHEYAHSIVARPATAVVPLQDQQQQQQQQQRGNDVVVLSKVEEYSRRVQSVTSITIPARTFPVTAEVVLQPSLEARAGNHCSHSQGISMPAKPAVVAPSMRVSTSTAVELDATSTATERRSRRARGHEGAENGAEKVPASYLAATDSPPNETANRSSSDRAGPSTAPVAAGAPREPKKTPRDSHRSSAASKPASLPQQAEQLQPAESEALATTASQPTTPTSKTSVSRTTVDRSPEVQILKTRRHVDPSPVPISPLSESSSQPQRARQVMGGPKSRQEMWVSPAAAAASPSISSSDAPPSLPPPLRAKPTATASSEPDKPSAPPKGNAAVQARRSSDGVVTSKDDDSCRQHSSSQGREFGTTEAATEASATPDRCPRVSKRVSALSAISTSLVPSMSMSVTSPCVAGYAADGHRSGFREAPLVSDNSTQTEFVFVLDDMQGRYVQQRQQEQLAMSLQLTQLQLQQRLLQMLDAGSYVPYASATASTLQVLPSPQPDTSANTSPPMQRDQRAAGISTGISPTHQRRGYVVNNSKGVRDALWWAN
ncbi:hypothetical protein Q4I28_000332 [Leishmania naiffi]|uniref:Uncharacterized protein n=1 Tax=Leishmania naiffi TaxID=5678 RepID=A0AAW3C9H2_9TRYP